MKNALLAVIAGIWLASLSAHAATITDTVVVGNTPTQTPITPLQVDPAVFGGSQTPNALVIGPQSVLITFANRFIPQTPLAIDVILTNAKFASGGTITFYDMDPLMPGTSVGPLVSISPTGCAITTANNQISITGCVFPGTAGVNGVAAMAISGAAYTQAAALSTPGTSIQMTAVIANGKNKAQIFESAPVAAVATSTGTPPTNGGGITPSASYTLQTTTSGNGTGTISRTPSGTSYTSGTVVVLTATPAAGSTFGGWSGACSGASSTCQVAMSANQSVTGAFTLVSEPLRLGTIFSSAQTISQSFIRLYNSGASAGTATIALSDPSSGTVLARWTSPSITPGAAFQFPISQIESAATSSFTKPNFYSAVVEASFSGSLQHVLWRIADGTLTNLSTCSAGVAALPTRLPNVHSSLVGNAGYPSSVAIYNTGPTAASAVLSVYNAATGSLLGTYSTAQIVPNGQIIVPVSQIETGAHIFPTVAAIPHYVITASSQFTGYLQHLVTNQSAGVFTDMTTVCSLTLN